LYVTGFAAIQVLAKVALQGLHQAYPYWIPRARLMQRSPGIVAGIARVSLFAIPLAVVAAALVPAVAEARGIPEAAATWQWMLVGLPALALAELFVQVSVACGTLNVQVWARDVIRPLLIFGCALAFYGLGYAEQGLAWGFAVGLWANLVIVSLATWRVLRQHGIELSPDLRVPRELQSYATPAWANGLVGEVWTRLDTLVLALVAEPAMLGIYGVAKEFGSVVRSVGHGAFPILTALFSDAAHRAHGHRLASTYTYATTVAVIMQLPVVALFAIFGRELLALFGEQYVAGYQTVLLLAVGWLAYSWLGSAARIVEGFGRSGLALAATVLGVAVEALLLFVLCPTYGMEGAATAAGLSSIVAAGVRFYIACRLNGGRLPLTRGILEPAITSVVSTLAALLAFYVLRDVQPVWLRGAVALGVFLVVYGPLARRSFRLNSAAFSPSAR
jgi:O-antigen/teichoic acid export membrane protein